jgi:energy-coupling factor transport system ATP-binding protein
VPSIAGATIRARGWGWRHAGRKRTAISDLTLDIAAGERVLLLGASGSGKSTLVHALAGVLGDADDGEGFGSLTIDRQPARAARGSVGLLLQDPDSQVIMARIGDDVAFGCENLGLPRDEIWRRVSESLDAVGLRLPLDHSTSALSGGQKQRLALAGVLAMRPRLLLLDEPTANLDPDGVDEVRDAVAAVTASGATLIVIEHRVTVWRQLVDRVVVLDATEGVLADGPVDDVLSSQGARLAAAGVWVPEYPPAIPRRRGSTSSGPLLSASELIVSRDGKTVVAGPIDAKVTEGSMLALTGPNGSGKTTIALSLAGLLKPMSGSIEASDTLRGGLASQPVKWRSRDLLTRIGTVLQEPEHQLLATTVRKELELGPAALGLAAGERTARVDELLERLRLAPLADANPFTLSGGEKRRLTVGTVLATRPRVLVLDEPTFGQDSRTWAELVSLLSELLDDGSAIVAASHDGDFVNALADRRLDLTGRTP